MWVQEEADLKKPYEMNSPPFVVIGTIILWVAWLFFNGGSQGIMFAKRQEGTPKIVMNTIVAGAAGGLVGFVLKPRMRSSARPPTLSYDVAALCNGALGGLVGITGACAGVQPWGAFIIGCVSGVVYAASTRLCAVCDVDDPVEASAVHGFCGMWGLIAVGLFHNKSGLLTGTDKANDRSYFFGVQILGMIAIIAWVAIITFLFFMVAKYFNMLRCTAMEECLGLDITKMDEDAIPHIN